MPWPRRWTPGPARSPTNQPNAVVGACSPRLRAAVRRLPALGLRVRFAVAEPPKATPALGDDSSYRLRIDDPVAIAARTEWGALAALATLAQLAASGPFAVAEARDAPEFPWRGLMVDSARHFLTVATLKRTLDAMWFYKLNVLHLHLTDDQAFRFRSPSHPELASADAYAPGELRELVAYAADRGVRVVPELDMPGHTASWLAARPEWGAGAASGPSRRFGLHRANLNTANPQLLAAVDALLEELAATFPDECLHFGGDEAIGISDAAQGRFNRRVCDRLTALGKRPVGWDECLRADLPRAAVVQAWRGVKARDAAVNAGFDCVVSAPYYLDLFYPAEVHYAFDPAGDCAAAEAAMRGNPRLAHVRSGIEWLANSTRVPELPPGVPGKVLGGEACMWGELVTDDLLDARVWSRMPAIAERLWGSAGGGDPLPRLVASRKALARLGIVPEDRAAIDAYPSLAPLVEMLEPVKWYSRLLGTANMTRRMNGLGGDAEPRPYDADTPLTRLVDRVAPESLASRRAEADLAAGRCMARWITGWQAQREALRDYPHLRAELDAPSQALAILADIVAGDASARRPAATRALAGPFGEWLLPVALAAHGRV